MEEEGKCHVNAGKLLFMALLILRRKRDGQSTSLHFNCLR